MASQFVKLPLGGGGGANLTLSNLTGPLAINQNILFNADGTLSIGDAAGTGRPQNIYLAQKLYFFSTQNYITGEGFPETQFTFFSGGVQTAQLGQLDTGSQFAINNPPGNTRNSIFPNSAVYAGLTASNTSQSLGSGPFVIFNSAYTDVALAIGVDCLVLGHDNSVAGNQFRHIVWKVDGNSDIGSLDAGSTMHRPRNLYLAGYLERAQIATPTAPIASNNQMYFKSDNNPYVQNSSAVEAQVTTASENNAGNSSTALTINWATASSQKVTLTGNVTYTFSGAVVGGRYILKQIQGAGPFTATWPAAVKWPGGTPPTLTATSGHLDLITFYYDGTDFFGSFSLNYTP